MGAVNGTVGPGCIAYVAFGQRMGYCELLWTRPLLCEVKPVDHFVV